MEAPGAAVDRGEGTPGKCPGRAAPPSADRRSVADATPAQVCGVLPKDAVLVDLLEYTYSGPAAAGQGPWQTEQRLVAFVVRRRGVERVDLGASRPIAEAVDRWRQTLDPHGARKEDPEAAAILRRLVWEPLAHALADARTVLISPDGALARFPLAALPGKAPGTYLIEECCARGRARTPAAARAAGPGLRSRYPAGDRGARQTVAGRRRRLRCASRR